MEILPFNKLELILLAIVMGILWFYMMPTKIFPFVPTILSRNLKGIEKIAQSTEKILSGKFTKVIDKVMWTLFILAAVAFYGSLLFRAGGNTPFTLEVPSWMLRIR